MKKLLYIIYIIAIKTLILKILKTQMAKGTKLSVFEKGEITALKRVRKSQREISKALGSSKIVISNYLKSPNKYGTRKLIGRPEKLSPQFKRRIVCNVKKKTSSTSKILKYLVDASCSTRTIRRHLNNEKNEHKKIIHCPRLTMKYKEKRLEYARQYQTMNVENCFLRRKEIQFRQSKWFSEVLARKKISSRELLYKA